MTTDVPEDNRTVASVKLHPDLEVFLRSRCEKSGRSLEGEIVSLIGDALQLSEIPPAKPDAPFVCAEELMAEKAECQDCGQKIRHNAKLWGERHVQETGHNVHVTQHCPPSAPLAQI